MVGDHIIQRKRTGSKKVSKIPFPFVIVWSLFSIVIVILGAGFAGGFGNLIVVPDKDNLLSNLPWAFGWVFIITPFLLILARVLKKRKK